MNEGAGRSLFAEALIDLLRRESGSEAEPQDPEEFFSREVLREVRWLPRYLYRAGDLFWAFEVARDDFLAAETLDSMQAAQAGEEQLRVAVLIPEGEPYDWITRACETRGVGVVVSAEAGYGFLKLGGASVGERIALPTRIPPGLADRVGQLGALHEDFRQVLRRFSDAHQALRTRPREETDEEEQLLLKQTFAELIAVDPRFVGGDDPLEVLRTVEQWSIDVGVSLRDHYYHSYHNFLLGCVAIDSLYDDLLAYFAEAFPRSEVSVEYIWLLTALYHDIGYLVQRGREVREQLYGVELGVDRRGERRESLEDHEASERNEYWQSQPYRIHRKQLVSLYEHLTQESIGGDWTGETLLAADVPDHPLDRALTENFMSAQGHGAASGLRMVCEIERRMRGSNLTLAARQSLMKHVYVAALSIPFHDWRARELLREAGIETLSTRRFPVAALLMYIDSIQDDRRNPSSLAFEERDTLRNLNVEEEVVKAEVDLAEVSPKVLGDKRVEAMGVMGLLGQDGLKFEYPPEFVASE